ncbi:MAG: hypothetical protein MZV70_28795 [Desulfobacterales bacterium]|nr:hypothetical protein [Desulfobacterales bacterium]
MRRDRVKWNEKYRRAGLPHRALRHREGISQPGTGPNERSTSRPAAGATRFSWPSRGLRWTRSTSPRRAWRLFSGRHPGDPADLRRPGHL